MWRHHTHIASVNNTSSLNDVNIALSPKAECLQHNVYWHLEELLYYFNSLFLNSFCRIYWLQLQYYATYFSLSYKYVFMFCVDLKIFLQELTVLGTRNGDTLCPMWGWTCSRLQAANHAPHYTSVFTHPKTDLHVRLVHLSARPSHSTHPSYARNVIHF